SGQPCNMWYSRELCHLQHDDACNMFVMKRLKQLILLVRFFPTFQAKASGSPPSILVHVMWMDEASVLFASSRLAGCGSGGRRVYNGAKALAYQGWMQR